MIFESFLTKIRCSPGQPNRACTVTGLDSLDYDKYYPKIEVRKRFCEIYLKERFERKVEEKEVDDFIADCDLMAIASHLAWGVWALVQTEISDIDFDFNPFIDSIRQYPKKVVK